MRGSSNGTKHFFVMGIIQVTSREFRDNQASLFLLADKGEKIVINRRKKQSYMLLPVKEKDYDLSLSEETMQLVNESREEYARGETTVCASKEDLRKHLDSL